MAEEAKEEGGLTDSWLFKNFIWDKEDSLGTNLMWMGVTAGSLALTPFSGGTSLGGLALRGAARAGAKTLLRTGAKTAAREGAQEIAEAGVKTLARESAEAAAGAAVKTGATEAASYLGRQQAINQIKNFIVKGNGHLADVLKKIDPGMNDFAGRNLRTRAIREYIAKHGGIDAMDDVLKVPGLTDEMVALIKSGGALGGTSVTGAAARLGHRVTTAAMYRPLSSGARALAAPFRMATTRTGLAAGAGAVAADYAFWDQKGYRFLLGLFYDTAKAGGAGALEAVKAGIGALDPEARQAIEKTLKEEPEAYLNEFVAFVRSTGNVTEEVLRQKLEADGVDIAKYEGFMTLARLTPGGRLAARAGLAADAAEAVTGSAGAQAAAADGNILEQLATTNTAALRGPDLDHMFNAVTKKVDETGGASLGSLSTLGSLSSLSFIMFKGLANLFNSLKDIEFLGLGSFFGGLSDYFKQKALNFAKDMAEDKIVGQGNLGIAPNLARFVPGVPAPGFAPAMP